MLDPDHNKEVEEKVDAKKIVNVAKTIKIFSVLSCKIR